MDRLTPDQRHKCMSHIHSKGTKPERLVRRWLWTHGYRYRLNVKSVPGSPDIVMRRYRTAIFVNGCFWHGHHVVLPPAGSGMDVALSSDCCKIPRSNRPFWVEKIRRNQERDQRNCQLLVKNGWQVITVWECQLRPDRVEQTMCGVERLLNENLLSGYRLKGPKTYTPEEETSLPLAAEEATGYQARKHIEVVAAIIRKKGLIFATQRGYGEWKDWWEFPGGKMESGESAEEALRREIREELSADINVEELLCTVSYDYPKFHLTMHCFYCSLASEALHLNEHESARWLSQASLRSVRWLPADIEVLEKIHFL